MQGFFAPLRMTGARLYASGRQTRLSGWDVGLAEVIPFVEEWFAGLSGEGVGEAVAKVQTGLVTAFSEMKKGFPRDTGLYFVKRDYLNVETPEEVIQDV